MVHPPTFVGQEKLLEVATFDQEHTQTKTWGEETALETEIKSDKVIEDEKPQEEKKVHEEKKAEEGADDQAIFAHLKTIMGGMFTISATDSAKLDEAVAKADSKLST